MIRAVFKTKGGIFCGFDISGHSGYAEAGSDIVCAAVSAMASLVIHTASDIYNDAGEIKQNAAAAELSFTPAMPESSKLIEGLYDQIRVLADEYPEYVSVKIKKTDKAGK